MEARRLRDRCRDQRPRIHPNRNTHVEVCRYGKGQNALFGITAPLVDGGAVAALPVRLRVLRHPLQFLRSRIGYRASEHGVILLVMQSVSPTRSRPSASAGRSGIAS